MLIINFDGRACTVHAAGGSWKGGKKEDGRAKGRPNVGRAGKNELPRRGCCGIRREGERGEETMGRKRLDRKLKIL